LVRHSLFSTLELNFSPSSLMAPPLRGTRRRILGPIKAVFFDLFYAGRLCVVKKPLLDPKTSETFRVRLIPVSLFSLGIFFIFPLRLQDSSFGGGAEPLVCWRKFRCRRHFSTNDALENSSSFSWSSSSLPVDQSYFFSPAFKITSHYFRQGHRIDDGLSFRQGHCNDDGFSFRQGHCNDDDFSSPVVSLISISIPVGSLVSWRLLEDQLSFLGYRLSSARKTEVGRQKAVYNSSEIKRSGDIYVSCKPLPVAGLATIM